MSKIIEKSNYRVIVEPKTGGYFTPRTKDALAKEEKEICENMEEQIRRHIDGVARITIDWDTEEKCSHCGYSWDVDETGEPLCCDKAVEEFKQLQNQETNE